MSAVRFITDACSHSAADSGCQVASDYLGEPSTCLNCPFDECVLIKSWVGPKRIRQLKRNETIRRLKQEGVTAYELSERFGLAKRTIQRITLEKRAGDKLIRNNDAPL